MVNWINFNILITEESGELLIIIGHTEILKNMGNKFINNKKVFI